MAWTYFTEDLLPGGVITKAQRDEVLDALVERQHAAGSSAFAFDATYLAEVKASPILTDKLLARALTGGADQIPRRAAIFLERAAPKYAPTVGGTLYSSSTFRAVLTAELGISGADLNSVWFPPDFRYVNSAVYWNSLRRGINLLQHCKVAWKSTVTRYFKGNSATTSQPWQEFAAEAHGSSVTSDEGALLSSFANGYRIAGPERRLAALASQDFLANSHTQLSGTLTLFVAASNPHGLPEQEGIVFLNAIDSDSVFLAPIVPSFFSVLSIDYPAPDGNGIPATLRLQSWSDLSTFLAYQPPPENPPDEEYFIASVDLSYGNVWLSPNFTHT